MTEREKIQAEVDRNFDAFKAKLPELVKSHAGKFALLRHKEIVEIFDSVHDAHLYGEAKFDDGLYSVQQISDAVTDLGYFSHAMYISTVQSDDRASL